MDPITHPVEGPNGFRLVALVYTGGVGEVAVGLLENGRHTMLGLRWCPVTPQVQSWQGEETGWFLMPYTFASAIGRSLAQLLATGHEGVDPEGFQRMARWLSEVGGLDDAMCY
ncbi:MAG: hypothetical protein J5I93_14345 [Pirellulaceae bacterium]|nr:hypothetical protein [Pirellulaceae bacterium]